MLEKMSVKSAQYENIDETVRKVRVIEYCPQVGKILAKQSAKSAQ